VKKFSKGSHSSLNELNITPLLDLAFVLLVIFIITTPQLSNDLEMNLPKPNNQPPPKPPKINRITVDVDGHITVNSQAVELPALKTTLAALRSTDPDPSVVVSGAADVDYQRVVSVLDIVQQVDINKVALALETAR
jgi:biopolymer transport protein ExbD